jgi:hypothetical protein
VAALGKYGYEMGTSTRYHDLQDLFNNQQTLIGGSMNDCIKTTVRPARLGSPVPGVIGFPVKCRTSRR